MMTRFTIFLFVTILVLIAPVSANEIEAPFGFVWGQTKAEMQRQGIAFDNCSPGAVEVCVTQEAPQKVSFGEYYIVSFTDDGLQRVILRTQRISGDASGAKGKELYAQLKRGLGQKYGDPTIVNESDGNALFDDWDEFYQCMEFDGCGVWKSMWISREDDIIMLLIQGEERGEGYILLTYQTSSLREFMDKQKAAQEQSDLEAL